MLNKRLILLTCIFLVSGTSCSHTSGSNSLNLSEFLSQLVSIPIPKILLSMDNQETKEIEPNFKDEKIAYIYKKRRQLYICEENRLIKSFAETSKIYQINSRQYIIEFSCSSSAYSFQLEYFLCSVTNYGIEIKHLPVKVILEQEFNSNEQTQPVWIYRRLVSGLPKFDPDTLILKNDTVKNNGGYKAEYKFEDDEFKLLKYTIFPDFQMQQKGIRAKDIYP
jgi:hypothetical protein